MFREVRRKDRAITPAETFEVLERGEWGVLSTCGADGWPYGVPVNHAVVEGKIYLHCARQGHKLDNLSHNDKVSYCVVIDAEVMSDELSTRFASAVLFGRAQIVEDETERARALDAIVRRLAPKRADERLERGSSAKRAAVIRITPEHMTGKSRR